MAGIQTGPFGPGSLNAVIVDNDGNPSNNIDATANFTVKVDWQIDPVLSTMLASGSSWMVTVYAESIGVGFEGALGTSTTAHVNGTNAYASTVTVPAGTLPATPPNGVSGVYVLTAVLTFDAGGGVTRLAGFVELPGARIA